MKILTIEDLNSVRSNAVRSLMLREQSNVVGDGSSSGLDTGTAHMQILICGGTGCKASSSQLISERIKEKLIEKGIGDKVDVITTGCFGFCEKGPVVKIIPDNTFYTQVTPDDADDIVNDHIVSGKRVERLLYVDPKTGASVSDSKHMDFYRKQMRVALRNCGFIDPENIEEYIARDGYSALAESLLHKTPEDVIDEVKRSGLRGRGGGGFPTGVKWGFARKSVSDVKYVVCNADEGDPGAFMDRSIMEGDPHSIVEAMAICGYSIGSSKGLVYIRAEYPLAIHRLKTAIAQAREYGLLGDNILGSGFSFDIEIRYGAGAFVCGEETALIHSMEGKRGGDSGEYSCNIDKGCGMVLVNRHREIQGNQSVCPCRKNQQCRSDRGADGHYIARGHLRDRRRHQGRQEIQGGADRRTFRRMPNGKTP